MVCDRRQLGQALTNVVKNGVEAIETRRNRGEHSLAGDRVELRAAARTATSWSSTSSTPASACPRTASG